MKQRDKEEAIQKLCIASSLCDVVDTLLCQVACTLGSEQAKALEIAHLKSGADLEALLNALNA